MMSQLSYTHQPSLLQLEHRTLFQLLDVRTSEHPEKEAIVLYDKAGRRSCLTFAEWQTRSQSLAASLIENGLGRGDRVAVMLPNSLECITVLIALNRIGANAICIPIKFSADQLIGILGRLKSVALVCPLDEDVSLRTPLINAMKELKYLKVLINVGQQQYQHDTRGHVLSYTDLLSTGRWLDKTVLQHAQENVQFDDPALMLFTSGSSGVPRACQYTNQILTTLSDAGNICWSVTNESRVFNDRACSWAPGMFAGFALAVCRGATVVYVPTVMTAVKQEIDFVLQVLQDEECSHAVLFPYLLHDIASSQSIILKYNITKLTYAFTAGQPVAKQLMADILNLIPQLNVAFAYASTEANVICYQLLGNNNLEDYGWTSAQPHMEIKITDNDGYVLPLGESGFINLRGPAVFLGYVGESESSTSAKTRNGWFRTSDIGVMNEDGKLKIVGRMGDVIKKATRKFFPAEYEAAIKQSPLVAQAVVCGVPDKRLYEEICACIVLKDPSDHEAKKAKLKDWYEQQWPTADDCGLSRKPGHTIFVDKIPLTRTGKPDRPALKKTALLELGLQCDEWRVNIACATNGQVRHPSAVSVGRSFLFS